jgi:hypothetical protein
MLPHERDHGFRVRDLAVGEDEELAGQALAYRLLEDPL